MAASQIKARSGVLRLACGEECGRALHQVAGPDEMITTEIVVALGLPPRDAHRGDHRALKNLVFMGEQHATAQPIHSAAVGRVIAEIEFWIHHRALPLADIASRCDSNGSASDWSNFAAVLW